MSVIKRIIPNRLITMVFHVTNVSGCLEVMHSPTSGERPEICIWLLQIQGISRVRMTGLMMFFVHHFGCTRNLMFCNKLSNAFISIAPNYAFNQEQICKQTIAVKIQRTIPDTLWHHPCTVHKLDWPRLML
jgi:hypothetical protein